MPMQSLGTLDGTTLEATLRQYKAEYVEQNEAGGHVYNGRTGDGSGVTLVVYAGRDGLYRVTLVDSCNC